jgi:hypothetical protein
MRLLRRIFFCDVFILPRVHNRLVVAVLQYLRVQKRRYVEFWQGRVSHEPTEFPTTVFSYQPRNNSKKDKTKTSRMMGWIEIRPNKFLNQNFVRQGSPAKCKTRRFRYISLISLPGRLVFDIATIRAPKCPSTPKYCTTVPVVHMYVGCTGYCFLAKWREINILGPQHL